MTTDATENHDAGRRDVSALSEGLGPLVERLLKYSDIRRNDPRENREALRDLILGELADEVQAVRKAERERCALLAVDAAVAAVKKYEADPAPVRQPYANNRLMHVGWAAADAIRGLNV